MPTRTTEMPPRVTGMPTRTRREGGLGCVRVGICGIPDPSRYPSRIHRIRVGPDSDSDTATGMPFGQGPGAGLGCRLGDSAEIVQVVCSRVPVSVRACARDRARVRACVRTYMYSDAGSDSDARLGSGRDPRGPRTGPVARGLMCGGGGGAGGGSATALEATTRMLRAKNLSNKARERERERQRDRERETERERERQREFCRSFQ